MVTCEKYVHCRLLLQFHLRPGWDTELDRDMSSPLGARSNGIFSPIRTTDDSDQSLAFFPMPSQLLRAR
jgi:hypothetical protein